MANKELSDFYQKLLGHIVKEVELNSKIYLNSFVNANYLITIPLSVVNLLERNCQKLHQTCLDKKEFQEIIDLHKFVVEFQDITTHPQEFSLPLSRYSENGFIKMRYTNQDLKMAYQIVQADLFNSLLKAQDGDSIHLARLGKITKSERKQKCGKLKQALNEQIIEKYQISPNSPTQEVPQIGGTMAEMQMALTNIQANLQVIVNNQQALSQRITQLENSAVQQLSSLTQQFHSLKLTHTRERKEIAYNNPDPNN
ncbi:11726_t:CDS:2 [Racocetra fulgida]|uniref:11726_t:CDS:1 n=1 Tax=Racocetra fulgida TaxID=60492 RepID=A0A9N9A1V3_9GLOM|nr:11726_t:CDS:2 [Racocetra fulgida]